MAPRKNSPLNFTKSLIFMVAAAGAALALTLPVPVQAAAQPKAVVPLTEYDFGEVLQDRSLSYTFTIRNSGKAPLKILKVDPDCACTVPAYDREIAPGKTGKITLALKPYSVSKKFTKKTKISFNDPDTPQVVLVLSGVARPMVEIEPGHVIRFKGGVNQEHQAEVRFTSNYPDPWEIKAVQNTIPDKIEVDLKTVEPGKVYSITVRNKVKDPGRYAGRITLLTTAQKRPRLMVRVFADLSPASPSSP